MLPRLTRTRGDTGVERTLTRIGERAAELLRQEATGKARSFVLRV